MLIYLLHVVIAIDEHNARRTCPCGDECAKKYEEGGDKGDHDCFWHHPENATIELIGVSTGNRDCGLVISSFNAG